ncbi:MAG TPA: hypothetical protein VGS62_10530 [Streptosporangiaceae bacterium]|nr:hypothetical protein [Streptosporangiaceae bacterium]
MTTADPLSEAVDELYTADPDAFTERRTALAAQARAAGDAAAARSIAKLRKPTRSAWAINQVVRADPSVPDRLAGLGDQLRAAEQSLDGAKIRELSLARRQLIDALVADTLAVSGQQPPPAALREEVTATFGAALADRQFAEQLAAGILLRAERRAGFGSGAGADLLLVKPPGDTAPAAKARSATTQREAQPAAPGKAQPAAPGKARPAAPGKARPAAPGRARPAAPGEARTAAPGEARPAAPGSARGSAVGGTPGEARTAAPGEARTAAPEGLRAAEARAQAAPQRLRAAEARAQAAAERLRAAEARAQAAAEQAQERAAARARAERERQQVIADAERTVTEAGQTLAEATVAEREQEAAVRQMEEQLAEARLRLSELRLQARRAKAEQRKAQERLDRFRG